MIRQIKSSLIRVMIINSFLLVFANMEVFAQETTVHGTVRNGVTGETLPGVNIVIQGTSVGTATDLEGSFNLNVSSLQETLILTYIGFERKTVPIDGRAELNIELSPSLISGEEIVVVGYSSRTQRDISSSIQSISGDNLTDQTSPDLVNNLKGKAAGVSVSNTSGQPGTAPTLRIRGTGSISADSEPLYVVDGLIGDVNDVNPNDVESVTILKDADATSLYGSRGANGVVLITTKKGAIDDTIINLNIRTGFSERVEGNFHVMNSQQLYDLYSSVTELPQAYLQRDTDWASYAFQTGFNQNYQLSVSSGNEDTRVYISGNYYNEEGVVTSTGYERLSARVNIEHDLNDRLKLIARLSGNNSLRDDITERAQPVRDAYITVPWDYPYNEDGTLRDGTESNWYSEGQRNFLHDFNYNSLEINQQNYQGDLKVEYSISDWLVFSSSNRVGYNYNILDNYVDPLSQIGSATNGKIEKVMGRSNSVLTSNLLNADYDFGIYNVGGLVGFEYSKNNFEDVGATATDGSSGLVILNTMANPLNAQGAISESAFTSGLVQGFINYDSRYSATASYRIDGSSRFGEDNRYGNFYSFSGSWLLSNEQFFNLSAVDLLKLRASYGITGNAEIGNYVAQGLYDFGRQYGGAPAGIPGRLANPFLTWEKAHELNFGLDSGFFERVELSLDVYRKINEDLLQNVPIEGTAGITSVLRNVGSVKNSGIEVNVTTLNIQGEFNWTSNLSFGYNKNEVLDLHQGEPIIDNRQQIAEGQDLRTWYIRKWAGVDPANGQPLWEQLVYDGQGNVTDVVLTSNYNDATLQTLGNGTPDLTGGFRNTFQYKGFSLDSFIYFVTGYQIYDNTRWIHDNDGAYLTRNARVLDSDESRWEKPGDVATHPEFKEGGNLNSQLESSRWLEDGSYLRLQNVTFSYELPNNLLQNFGIRTARVYVSGDNLLTLTDYSGADPSVGISSTDTDRYPSARKFLFGINLSF